ncbi:permease [Seminavis robusta]|uniref:Permease n=1 Tax=Seminavis robusta TaxID=568900 RepID=A0A9N8EGY9_9STRA|nr:permease [Seminavis robusta]|eukprot:Sro1187_g250440.1 permease (444) ;mRNA; r:7216-8547
MDIPEYIDDPDDLPPEVDVHGEPRMIENGCDVMPDDWDEEDDGEWAPALVENPDYQWTPRQIRNPEYVEPPTFSEKLYTEVQAALPWVTLGILLTGLLSSVTSNLPLDLFMTGLLNTNTNGTGIVQLLWAAVAGLTVPLCSCGALPLCAGLLHGTSSNTPGLPLSIVMAFLTASQSAGIDSAAITYGLLGPTAMMGRLLGAMLLAVAVGLACPSSSHKQQSKTKNLLEETCHPSVSTYSGIVTIWFETALEIYPTVLTGLALSTAALHYLPSLTNYSSFHNDETTTTTTTAIIHTLLTRGTVLASAIPLQLCEHTSVTLAAALQKAGGSPGLAFGFLLSAPAINLPSLLFVATAASVRAMLQIVTTLTVTAVILSCVADAAHLDFMAGHATGDMATLPDWFAGNCTYLAVMLVVGGLLQKYSTTASNKSGDCCDTSNGKIKAE